MTIANGSSAGPQPREGIPAHRRGWPGFADYRPHPSRRTLVAALDEAHTVTKRLFAPVPEEALDRVPLMAIVNPPRWELGHVAWFHEFWIHRRGDFGVPPLVRGADRFYDSSNVPHDTRWDLDLPSFVETWRYLDEVHQKTRRALEDGPADEAPDDELAYFVQLGLLHHDMHNEAFAYMWQTLGFPDAAHGARPAAAARGGDVTFGATRITLGRSRGSGFFFDNEKWAHEVEVPAFAMSRSLVRNGEFEAFVEDGGYARREFWSEAGWQMKESLQLRAPRYWKRENGGWRVRRNDTWLPLAADEPVRHVSWHEAQAFCRWAGRRLPTEAEWVRAAQADAGLDDMFGMLWQWTETRFGPFDGFSPDPYRDYSAPWFATDHRVLRGGSFATPLRIGHATFRNFYAPHRADVFCGFRTCAA